MHPVLVFDIETIPDVPGLRRLHDLSPELSDAEVAELAFQQRRAQNGTDFLPLHLQRIALWHGLGDEAATAAAVIDLWIILGALGQELRTRMLRQHYAALDKLDLGLYLSERLEPGLDRHDPLIALPGSVLSRPVAGARAFLRTVPLPSATAP